jgi:AcrR family transcriptional regulator
MPAPQTRPYHSPARRKRATETRGRIITAARKLFAGKGYDQASIEDVAAAAGVSAATVFAVFGSKRGILAGLLDRALYGNTHAGITAEARKISDPVKRLRFVASIARQVHDSEKTEMTILRGLSNLSPEIADLERAHENRRFRRQKQVIRFVAQAGRLRDDLAESEARDILWTLTSRDIYRKMVIERRWTSAKYQDWLAGAIERSLVKSP